MSIFFQVGLLSSPQDEKSGKGMSSSCYGKFDEEAETNNDQVQAKFKVISTFQDI
jgi:hypothetical protein